MSIKKSIISITGVDGAGKTTQARYIVDELGRRGHVAAYWKSPSFDWLRSMLKVSGNDSFGGDIWTDATMFATAHRLEQYLIRGIFNGNIPKQLREEPGVIKMLSGQSLPANVLVGQRGIIDFYSFLMAEGLELPELNKLLRPEAIWAGYSYKPGEFIIPSVIVYLECDPGISMSRIKREDKWEEVPFLKKLVTVYEQLFTKRPFILKNARVIRVNAEPTIAEVQADINKEVMPVLEELVA